MKLKTLLPSLLAGLTGGLIVYLTIPTNETTIVKEKEIITERPAASFASLKGIKAEENFIEAAEISKKSVVFIKTKSTNTQSWFDWYFYGHGSESISSGSGVILKSNGYIITNHHVIENGENIEVLHGKKTYDAKVIGYDRSTDLAVLKIEADNLPAITIGSSTKSKIGEWVLAVGNPLNLESTVTAGIISAKGRVLNLVHHNYPIESFIQTDAAINPGNSGGALVNIKGELIGINTAIVSKTGAYSGYGFAVPVDIVVKVVDDIIKFGEVQKALFGGDISELNQEIADQLNIQELEGVVINFVEKEGAAEKAGLRKGDIILSIDNRVINSAGEFNEIMAFHRPGDRIRVKYRRSTGTSEKSVVLLNRDGGTQMIERRTVFSKVLGADLEVLSNGEKKKLNLKGGVRIVKVSNGLFKKMQIKNGFVVTSINGVSINTIQDLESILSKIKGRVVIRGLTENGTSGYYSFYF